MNIIIVIDIVIVVVVNISYKCVLMFLIVLDEKFVARF